MLGRGGPCSLAKALLAVFSVAVRAIVGLVRLYARGICGRVLCWLEAYRRAGVGRLWGEPALGLERGFHVGLQETFHLMRTGETFQARRMQP
jgi:hypothetical protein